MRGWISLLVWLLVAMPEARGAFLVEFQGDRGQAQIHSVISVNAEGVVLRPVGGGFGNGVRHRWDEFTARSLGVILSELLKDPVFNQKSREAKFKIMDALETARKKQTPPAVAPPAQPVQPAHPAQPIQPIQPPAPQPVLLTNAPAPPAVNPNTGMPQPVQIAAANPAPTNSLPPQPQPATNAAAAPASTFQLAEPPGVASFPERRPPASVLSPEVVFNPAGIFLALLVMALSGYAGFEIARFKNRPVKLVCALSAALPVLGPAVFLALPPQAAVASTAPAALGVPGAAELPGTTPPTPLPAPRSLKYEDDPDSPYANLPAGGVEETQFAEEPFAAPSAPSAPTAPVPVAQSLEHYHSSEYDFTPAFFSEYFAQFVGAAATSGEALILRTASTEYSVHYISAVDATGLQFIFADQGQWMEEFVTYADLTEVEVLGHV